MVTDDRGIIDVYASQRFIAWLKKRGRIRGLKDCKRKCNNLDVELNDILKNQFPTLLLMLRTRGGEKVVMIMDLTWADDLAETYDIEIPHHGQRLRHPL